MLILPIITPLLKKNDDLGMILRAHAPIQTGDILVVSSKAIATVEGAEIALSSIDPSVEAQELSKACHQDPQFTQAILNETLRMHGSVTGTCPFAVLTSLKPDGLRKGRILCPNAGLDQSNIEEGYAIGWPKNPEESVQNLVKEINLPIGIIISDSCCRPARLGVTAFALVCYGFDPLQSQIGKTDLFQKNLRVTVEATADQLATAANMAMGNAGQSTPAAIIRNHGIPLSPFCGWVDGIEPEEDLFG